jgi:NTP-dependent ternary system trypsin peptidase co-occuring protein
MRLDDDGLAVEELVGAVRRAAAQAAISDADAGRDMRITGLELTLHAVAKRDVGSKLEFRIPVLGMPISIGAKVTTHDTHKIKISLVPVASGHQVRGGDVEETLVQAIETVRAVVARGLGESDAFEHRSSEVELSFAVTDSGSIALVGTADLSGEVTHTLKLTLGPA